MPAPATARWNACGCAGATRLSSDWDCESCSFWRRSRSRSLLRCRLLGRNSGSTHESPWSHRRGERGRERERDRGRERERECERRRGRNESYPRSRPRGDRDLGLDLDRDRDGEREYLPRDRERSESTDIETDLERERDRDLPRVASSYSSCPY
jgi:hypothetical protein